MKELNKISVKELLNLLVRITKENVNQMEKNGNLAKKMKAESNSYTEKVNKLYQSNADITAENRDLITLFNYILNFYKKYKTEIELSADIELIEITQNTENKQENSASATISNINADSEQDTKYSSMSLSDLESLLEQFIQEENYEECEKIKQVIFDKA